MIGLMVRHSLDVLLSSLADVPQLGQLCRTARYLGFVAAKPMTPAEMYNGYYICPACLIPAQLNCSDMHQSKPDLTPMVYKLLETNPGLWDLILGI